MKRQAWAFAVSMAAVCLAATGCSAPSSTPVLDMARPSFGSITEVAQEADAVVRGRVTEEVGRELDGGGESDESVGVPIVIYRLSVTKVLMGAVPSKDVLVTWIDSDKVINDFQTRLLAKGADLVLFLQFRPAGDSPGVTSVGDHYVVVGGDQGTFDVVGADIQARAAEVRQVKQGGPVMSDSPARFPLVDVEAALLSADLTSGP